MQLKDVTPIIKAILDERNKIPLMINTERYIPNWQPNLNGNAMRGGIRKALRAIEQAPVVDAVPVVRKPVKGYEGYYEVDQFGRVYGCDRCIPVDDNGRIYVKPVFGKQMKQALHTKGYKIVSLTRDGRTKTAFVHRLVAEAFLPNPDALPYVNHKDEDKTNNFLDNLEWCTAQYNSTYGNARKKQAKKSKGFVLAKNINGKYLNL